MRFRSLRHPPSILRAIAFRLTPDYLIGWLICTPTRSFAHPLEYSHVQVIRSRFVHIYVWICHYFSPYSVALTVFSPDGHLFQVRSLYAVLERASHAS